MQNNFFGSKLNSVLLLILIILLGFVLRFMYQEKATYLPFMEGEKKEEVKQIENPNPLIDNSQIEGNKEDLISFSILPNSEVKGVVSYRGEIKGGYFFEANILVAVTDINKKVIKQSNGISTTDWMTAGPVKFEGNMDFSKLPNGKAYLKIQQDDPSDGESGKPIKQIFIPINIKNEKEVYSTTTSNEKRFSGKITARDDGCFVDGLCFIEVDKNYWVLYTMGWNQTKGTIEGELNIGAKVEVYAQKFSDPAKEHPNTYSIVENEKYYIKVIK